MKIYSIKKRKNDNRDEKNKIFLLYHGTSVTYTVGIVEKGFKSSACGIYGSGVYLTASTHLAIKYSIIMKETASEEKLKFVMIAKVIIIIIMYVMKILLNPNT